MLSIEEYSNTVSRQADTSITQRLVLRVLKDEKYHPYKIQLQVIIDDDLDRRKLFCEVFQNVCTKSRFIKH